MSEKRHRYREYCTRLSEIHAEKSLTDRLKSMKNQEFICSIPVMEEGKTEVPNADKK